MDSSLYCSTNHIYTVEQILSCLSYAQMYLCHPAKLCTLKMSGNSQRTVSAVQNQSWLVRFLTSVTCGAVGKQWCLWNTKNIHVLVYIFLSEIRVPSLMMVHLPHKYISFLSEGIFLSRLWWCNWSWLVTHTKWKCFFYWSIHALLWPQNYQGPLSQAIETTFWCISALLSVSVWFSFIMQLYQST